MYLSYYNLTAKPFEITTDPVFIWFGEKHAEALARLKYGIQEDKGFILLTGAVGTGKTVLINCLLELIDIEAFVAAIPDPDLNVIDFFNLLSDQFHLNKRFDSKADFLIAFRDFLHSAYSERKKVLLIVDEAQRLSHELLEQIRLLSNIEFSNRKLLNIFFVGQSEFNNILLERRTRAVRQRITVIYNLEPLTEIETNQYILHRLTVAGRSQQIFTPPALHEIYSFSAGNPRLINIICDRALLTGYSLGFQNIDVGVIKECADELKISGEIVNKENAGQKITEKKSKTPILSFLRQRAGKSRRWLPAAIVALVLITGYLRSDLKSDNFSMAPIVNDKMVIYFKHNSYDIQEQTLKNLNRLAEFLLQNPKSEIKIKGYTDTSGHYDYNVLISKKRATIIKNYLVKRGVKLAVIQVFGMGPQNPISSNESLKGRKRNRRVEIEFNHRDKR